MVAKREHCMEREPLPKNLKKSRNSDQELKAKEEAFQGEEAFQLLQETSKRVNLANKGESRTRPGYERKIVDPKKAEEKENKRQKLT